MLSSTRRSILAEMTNDGLNRALAHNRNVRDTFADGKAPEKVLEIIRDIQDEQAKRRAARDSLRNW